MKTPEEIKKALKLCGGGCYPGCPYNSFECVEEMSRDALTYIQQLENQLREATKKVEQIETEKQNLICDFMDYINDGIPYPAPFCAFRETCALVDALGWCKHGERGCNGFVPRVRDDHD